VPVFGPPCIVTGWQSEGPSFVVDWVATMHNGLSSQYRLQHRPVISLPVIQLLMHELIKIEKLWEPHVLLHRIPFFDVGLIHLCYSLQFYANFLRYC